MLEAVVAAVRTSAKYRHVDLALVRALAARELALGARPKDAAKQVKNKLHQVAGAYQVEPLHADTWLAAVEASLYPAGAGASLDAADPDAADPDAGPAPVPAPAPSADPVPATAVLQDARLRDLCRAQMARHASTRERLPILDEFYTTILADLPPIGTLLDLACGLNPLALPWMNLPPAATYWACDIYADQVDLLNRWFARLGRRRGAFLFDLANDLPGASAPPATRHLPSADVVLLLKALPCLQQLDRAIGPRLLDAIDAPTLIISYPAHSLGGHKHGMPAHYAAEFDRLAAGRGWHVDTFPFATELVYRIRR
jgi:16S rRNA (guanine(1405)-N(7))-methyltransferase